MELHYIARNELPKYWETRSICIEFADGSDALAQENGYTLEECLQMAAKLSMSGILIVRNPWQEQENWQKVSSGRSRNIPCHSFLRFQIRQTQFLSVSHNISPTEILEK